MTTLASILTGSGHRRLNFGLPLAAWLRVSRERRSLARLSDHQLRDIGIDAETAATEAARPFWDLPAVR